MYNHLKDYINSGKWIHVVIEGADATGKTTLCQALQEYISKNITTYVRVCAQPYTNMIPEYLRTIENRTPEELFALFLADGIILRYNIEQDIKRGKEYNLGGFVIQDRHVMVSTCAYQLTQIDNSECFNEILDYYNWKVADDSLLFITNNEPFVIKEEMHNEKITNIARLTYRYFDQNRFLFETYRFNNSNIDLSVEYILTIMEAKAICAKNR